MEKLKNIFLGGILYTPGMAYRRKVVSSLGPEIAVEIDHSPKSFDPGACFRFRHIDDDLNFRWLRCDPFSVDDVAEVVDLGGRKE